MERGSQNSALDLTLDFIHKVRITVLTTPKLYIQILKYMNNLNRVFMKKLFNVPEIDILVCDKYKLNLVIFKHTQVQFRRRSFRVFVVEVWKSSAFNIKPPVTLTIFSLACTNFASIKFLDFEPTLRFAGIKFGREKASTFQKHNNGCISSLNKHLSSLKHLEVC